MFAPAASAAPAAPPAFGIIAPYGVCSIFGAAGNWTGSRRARSRFRMPVHPVEPSVAARSTARMALVRISPILHDWLDGRNAGPRDSIADGGILKRATPSHEQGIPHAHRL